MENLKCNTSIINSENMWRRDYMNKLSLIEKIVFLSVAFLLLNVLSAYATVPSEPHNANAMWVEPSSLDLTTASVGYKFNLTVWLNLTTLDTATAIQAWQFNLTYNTQYLNISRYAVTNNNVTSELFQGLTTMPTFSVNEEKGYVFAAELTVAGNKPLPCNGSLAWIEFEIVSSSTEQLTIYFNIAGEERPEFRRETYVADTDYNCYYPPDDLTAHHASALFPEFPPHLMLIFGMVLTLVAASLAKKRMLADKNN
jgi:hypothetical protein